MLCVRELGIYRLRLVPAATLQNAVLVVLVYSRMDCGNAVLVGLIYSNVSSRC